MSTANVKTIKAQLFLMLNGNATNFQFHKIDEVISAYGHQLTSPRFARGNLDRYGNGRYVVAEFRSGVWQSIHGESLDQ